jgi:hypothetical protein
MKIYARLRMKKALLAAMAQDNDMQRGVSESAGLGAERSYSSSSVFPKHLFDFLLPDVLWIYFPAALPDA